MMDAIRVGRFFAPGSIPVPPRLPSLDAALVLLAAALLTAFPFARALGPWEAPALLVLGVLGWRRRARPLLNLGTFGALLVGIASVDRLMQLWPLPAFLALVGLFFLVRSSAREDGALPSTLPFLRRGVVDGTARLLIAASALVAGAALIAWFALAHPDYTGTRTVLLPPVPAPLLLLGVVLFSAVNGALEEIAYRGVLLDALDAALGVGVAAVLIQALAFGAMHFSGFPRGAAGVGLAAVYGVMMGAIRRRTRGLLAPWLAHILADVTIGVILILSR
jgi:membrane protease YdiL (CAAX protease family)